MNIYIIDLRLLFLYCGPLDRSDIFYPDSNHLRPFSHKTCHETIIKKSSNENGNVDQSFTLRKLLLVEMDS